ncbi:MAG: dockerin type I repeat-containing protein, partial [Clostridia bacterium]|nr:dockerin type I repeat-containing protein [Clostridia bacterium]
ANTSQGMGMIKNNIYSAVILSKDGVEETYLYRTNINYPNSSKNLGQYDYLGHCNDLIAFSYGGKPYLLAAKDHKTVNLVCVADDSVVKTRTFTIGGSSGFGGVCLLSVNGSKVKLLVRGYPKATGMTFGTCEFDMANLPANNADISFTNSFSVSFDSICTTIGNTIGYSDCLTIGTSVDGISQPGIYLTQSIAYDPDNDRLYIPVMVLRKAKASDEKTSYKYGVFVVYNGVTIKLPGKTDVAVDDFFGYTDNYLEIQSAGFYNGLMYFSATVTHEPETWSRDCNFYTVPVKTTKISGTLSAGINAPEYDGTPDGASAVTTGANHSCTSVVWTPNDGRFKAGTVYKAKITLKADAEYSFNSNNINVPGASSVTDITSNYKTITFTATFPETADLKLADSAASEGYKLDDTGFYGFAPGTPVETIIAHFKYDVTVKDKNGNVMTSGNVGTGCTVSCAGKTATALLRADVDGDGEITSNDYTAVKSMFKTSTVILDGVYKKMADVDKNEKYTVTDYLMIKRSVNGTFSIKNN